MNVETPVIFRKYQDGEIIAIFPTLPWGSGKTSCVAFTAANKRTLTDISIMRNTKEAEPFEYQYLLAEVVHQGYYPLKIVKRVKQHLNDTRMEAAKKVGRWGFNQEPTSAAAA